MPLRSGHPPPGHAASPAIIELRWLVFLRVVALGSLSKTAAALDMPQSMVSRHIAQLEQQCGERLFRRTGRGVVLTDVGEQLLPRIAELAAGAERLADDIRSMRGQPVGEVVVGLGVKIASGCPIAICISNQDCTIIVTLIAHISHSASLPLVIHSLLHVQHLSPLLSVQLDTNKHPQHSQVICRFQGTSHHERHPEVPSSGQTAGKKRPATLTHGLDRVNYSHNGSSLLR